MMNRQQRYISNELIHLTAKGKPPGEQYKALLRILKKQELHHSPEEPNTWGENNIGFEYRYNERISDDKMINSSMVCFCDIPFEDLSIHIQKYSPFGLSFKKDFVASKGGCPVFYIPKHTPVSCMNSTLKKDYFDESCKKLYHYFDDLLCSIQEHSERKHIQKLHNITFNHILSYIKFFDHKLLENHAGNYYFEREWRVLGNFCFQIEDIQRIIMPKSFAEDFRRDFQEYYGQLSFVDTP